MHTDLQAMNAAELMDRVFVVYKNSFFAQFIYSGIIFIIFITLTLILTFVWYLAIGFASNYVIAMRDSSESAVIGILIATAAVIIPVYVIGSATVEAGHILLSLPAFCGKKTNLYRREKTITTAENRLASFRHMSSSVGMPINQLPKIILRVISVTIAQFILSIPFIAICALCVIFLINPNPASGSFYSLLSFMSTPAWVILAVASTFAYIIYSNLYALSIPVAVYEKRPFFNAVVKSWRLIKGEFWKILGLRVLWVTVVYVFTYSAQGAWALLNEFFGFSSNTAFTASVISALVGMLISFLVWPLNGIFSAVLYFNQRIKREGMDIEIAIERLSA